MPQEFGHNSGGFIFLSNDLVKMANKLLYQKCHKRRKKPPQFVHSCHLCYITLSCRINCTHSICLLFFFSSPPHLSSEPEVSHVLASLLIFCLLASALPRVICSLPLPAEPSDSRWSPSMSSVSSHPSICLLDSAGNNPLMHGFHARNSYYYFLFLILKRCREEESLDTTEPTEELHNN